MKKELTVKSQSIETSGITKDYREALCEYIWNGFEANAVTVAVSFDSNELEGVESVCVQDDGDGICYETIDDTFGAFLASNKNGLSLQLKSKSNKGKGRFSCYAFAREALQETVVFREKEKISYTIRINDENKNEYDLSDPIIVDDTTPTGTIVTITGISGLLQEDLDFVELEDTFLRTFAWYLYLNRNKRKSLLLNGEAIDFENYIDSEASITETVKIGENVFSITLIVWVEKIKENFCAYYLDANGKLCGKDTTTFNRNTINFNHSVYVQSLFFEGKKNISLSTTPGVLEGQMQMEEDDRAVLRKLKKKIQDLIGRQMNHYMAGQADKAVAKMVERKSFPTFSDDLYGQMRKRELLQVTKAIYCVAPRVFHQLKDVQEKSLLGMLNLLLNTDERENVLSIIEGIVELTPTQRQDFAVILKRTKLGNIVDTIRFIEERYKVIEGLRRIVFNLSQYANERDHIQKIIAEHYWIFGEQYNLVSADQRMQTALGNYMDILYGEKPSKVILQPDDDYLRRMDIFTCGKRRFSDGTGVGIEENLIIELKAPRVPLTKTVLRQVEDYMDFIRKQPQFNSQYRIWKFIAVCTEVDDDIKSRYSAQKDKGKLGLVTAIDNYEVYALTWDDVFKSFEIRHSFLLDKLKVDQEAIAEDLTATSGSSEDRETANNITDSICTALSSST